MAAAIIMAAAAVLQAKTRILLKTTYRKALRPPRTAKILKQHQLLPLHRKAVQANLSCFLILALVIGIGAAGFIIPKFLNKPKKNNIEYEDDELDEVSEDSE